MGMFASIAKEGLLKDLIKEVGDIPTPNHGEGEIVKNQVLIILRDKLDACEFD